MENLDPAAYDRLTQRAGAVLEALSACLADSRGKPRPHRGEIQCPACGGRLGYLAKTSAPGTIWGTCSTPGCISWMV